jgi:hypothetical protein
MGPVPVDLGCLLRCCLWVPAELELGSVGSCHRGEHLVDAGTATSMPLMRIPPYARGLLVGAVAEWSSAGAVARPILGQSVGVSSILL